MTDRTKKASGKGSIMPIARLIGAIAALLAAIPALYGMITGQGPVAAYQPIFINIQQLLGGDGSVGPRDAGPGPKGDQSGDARSKPPPAPPPVQAELPMSRMSSDARLSMALVSLKPLGPNARQIIATYARRWVGAPSQPFVLSDGNQDGWSVDADRAGHCWQTKASALDAFYRSELDGKIAQLPTMSPGQVFYIRAELFCDANPLAGDTAVATATPYVLAADGSRTAVPIRFQSGRVPVTP